MTYLYTRHDKDVIFLYTRHDKDRAGRVAARTEQNQECVPGTCCVEGEQLGRAVFRHTPTLWPVETGGQHRAALVDCELRFRAVWA